MATYHIQSRQVKQQARMTGRGDGRNLRPDNLADYWDLATIPSLSSGEKLSVRHEVSRQEIEQVGVKLREEYEVKLSEKCMGTVWWMYGEMPLGDRVRIKDWVDKDEMENTGRRLKDDDGDVYRGEQPEQLALVDEGGSFTFEVV
ncbi:MAG: hypothetical protein Q9181_000933 [Wetmoreana brouardii]